MCPARVGAPQRARPGTGSAIFLASVAKAYPCHIAGRDVPDEKRGHHHPNPVFLLRLFGLFLLRYAQRTFLVLLLKAPPRNTRWCDEPIPSAGQRQTVTASGPRRYRLASTDWIHPPSSRPISATIPAA
jgi:hypothetical protein